MKQLHPIIIVPTEKASRIQGKQGGILSLFNTATKSPYVDAQHLYVLSDEPIKDFDKIYFTINGKGYIGVAAVGAVYGEETKKIIATTDESLGIKVIQKSFLPIFVEAYNSGKPITEVELDYATDNNIEGYPEFGGNGMLKTTESNEVIIFLPEVKMYSRDEVIEKMKISIRRGVDLEAGALDFKEYGNDEEWIKQNL